MKKTKISKLGRRGKIVLAVLIAAMFIGVASAGLLTYYNKLTMTANVSQPVLLDGNDYTNPVKREFNATGGDCKGSCHLLENIGNVDVPIVFDTQYWPDGDCIDVKYYKSTGYTEAFTVDIEGSIEPLEVTVEDGDCWVTWTFDFPVEGWTGDGNLNVGLIIALDGNGSGPAFQIHNNDGTDANYPWGTWLMSPWGPTITDGWFGWHSGDTNIPVADVDWVEATGNRNVPHGAGILEIKISKCKLGETFHWAASPTVGSGFWEAYDVTMQIPTGFSWSLPIVDMGIPNYIVANIMTEITSPFTLPAYFDNEWNIIICYSFDAGITPRIYRIESQFQPAPP